MTLLSKSAHDGAAHVRNGRRAARIDWAIASALSAIWSATSRVEERRAAILNSIREQGKLDTALETAILASDSKGLLEDIYSPRAGESTSGFKAAVFKEVVETLNDLASGMVLEGVW